MPYYIRISILILTPFILYAQAGSRYTSPNGGYSVLFPSQPIQQIQSVETEVGSIELISMSCESSKAFFMASYAQYPRGHVNHDHLDQFYSNIRTGAVKNSGGTLVREKKMSVDGYPGIEFTFKSKQGDQEFYVTQQAVIVGDRLFQFVCSEPELNPENNAVKLFFNSIHITFNPDHLAELFQELKYKYDRDNTGQYYFQLSYEDGRKQVLYFTPTHTKTLNRQLVDIWSPIAVFKATPGDSTYLSLLKENANVELGSFQLVPVEDGLLLVFGLKYDISGLTANQFQALFSLIASYADDTEKSLTGTDLY